MWSGGASGENNSLVRSEGSRATLRELETPELKGDAEGFRFLPNADNPAHAFEATLAVGRARQIEEDACSLADRRQRIG